LGNATRAVFQQWNVTHGSPSLRLSISRDICLLAIYRKQYHLNVKSILGLVSGSGWYDKDSIALFQVTPPVVTLTPAHVFIGWSGDSVDYSPASSVLMNRSKDIEASWRDLSSREGNSTPLQVQALFVASLTTLMVSLVFALISFHHRHRQTARQADVHQLSTQNYLS
jgi:hypothetical protein